MDEVMAYQPDMVKGFHDGWRYGSGADNVSIDETTLTGLASEAHKFHKKLLTHTVTVERGEEAARAGVDVVAHSLQDAEITQKTVDLFKAHGTAYAPTLAVYEPVKPGQPPRKDDTGLKASLVRFDHAFHNLKRFHDAGVLIALGTDAGMPGTPHGTSTLHEMELMVKAGLTPTDALLAGTANSAKAIGLIEDRGTIEKGKRADLVLIKGTPGPTSRTSARPIAPLSTARRSLGRGHPSRWKSRHFPAPSEGSCKDRRFRALRWANFTRYTTDQ
jgi:imidazolonepropionase-like amidohydrolase